LEIDQLYVKQRQNQLTVNGELLWPKKDVQWMKLPFRGQLNAAIPDLNAFAQLFGATTGAFHGELSATGELDLLDRAPHGRLALRGEGVTFRDVALESLGASLRLRDSEATLENLEVRHGDDFLRAHGVMNLATTHRYSGRLTGAINDLGVYAPFLPASWRTAQIGGGATFDWTGDGTAAAHSGTLQLFAHGLQLPVAPLRMPLDVTLEGTYSPQDIFFRTFSLTSNRMSLGGYLMLGSNFIELQALELALDGIPRIEGTLFLPFGAGQLRKSGSLWQSLDERQKFDVDLAVDHLDLPQVARALGEELAMTGVLDGKLAAFGPLPMLQLTTSWHLENIGPGSPKNAVDFACRYAGGRAEVDATATFGVSDPITLRASLPLRLEKRRFTEGGLIDPENPFSVALDFPALFFETMPNELRPLGLSSGLLSGGIAFSSKWQSPTISGEAQIVAATLDPPAPWPALNNVTAQVRFENSAAVIDPLRLEMNALPVGLRGSLTTSLTTFALALRPAEGGIGLARLPQSGANLSTIRLLGEGRAEDEPRLQEAVVRGTIGSSAASITIGTTSHSDGAAFASQTTLFLRPQAAESSPLLLDLIAPERSGPAIELRKPRP
jgi:hypothetical protein